MDEVKRTWSHVGIISGIITLIGCFLPFLRSSGLFQPVRMYSVIDTLGTADLDAISGGGGIIILLPLIAGILSILLNITILRHATLVVAIVCAIPWLIFSFAIASNSSFSYVGVGFWVMTIGIVLSVIAPLIDVIRGNVQKIDW